MDNHIFDLIIALSLRHTISYKSTMRLNLIPKNQFQLRPYKML